MKDVKGEALANKADAMLAKHGQEEDEMPIIAEDEGITKN